MTKRDARHTPDIASGDYQLQELLSLAGSKLEHVEQGAHTIIACVGIAIAYNTE